MWDQRYDREEYVYGTAPNDFLVASVGRLRTGGRVLCLGEGEGRNGVWLAGQGFRVTGLDASAVGLAKAHRLAEQAGVEIETRQVDLAQADLGSAEWDAVVSIFCHLPPDLRRRVHAGVVRALRPGGVLVLEAYTPAQLDHGTGGPPHAAMMMDLATLAEELSGLEFEHAVELRREVREGQGHFGLGAVVQVVARKP
ncbi:class I SAM-dependent methyltransferase [Parasulfuritortus cantonensis]|uniref:Class I SAM-dependent methyltransferase n=1 Tax=Parasulfuritortus cantonensis TaxID=2528202 RepID=A0A4R1B240_9PROT|nr:class I SAM-dependent methyltransferase [Parasulfuritortus cantonensis]TCJ11881.1 class I SAM-dependent methyltransferase [Parasulfuritortus cantonensis]